MYGFDSLGPLQDVLIMEVSLFSLYQSVSSRICITTSSHFFTKIIIILAIDHYSLLMKYKKAANQINHIHSASTGWHACNVAPAQNA